MSDTSLLSIAEVSGGLMGLFLVGILFYLEGGPTFGSGHSGRIDRYLRASTRIVLLLYALPLVLPLAMVTFPLAWSRVAFAAIGLGLVAANVSTAVEMRRQGVTVASRALLVNEVAGTVGVITVVVIPWTSGGLTPDAADLGRGLVVSLVMALASTCTLVLWLFDLRAQARELVGARSQPRTGHLEPWTNHSHQAPPLWPGASPGSAAARRGPASEVTRSGCGDTAGPCAG